MEVLSDGDAELSAAARREILAALPPKARPLRTSVDVIYVVNYQRTPSVPSADAIGGRRPSPPPLSIVTAPPCLQARGALQTLEKSLVGKAASVDGFVEALWVAEETLGEQCVRLDKKREKAAIT